MIVKTINTSDPEYEKELWLRDEILRRPIGLSLFDEDLSREDESTHIVAVDGGRVIGCLMLTPIDGENIKMRQVTVEPKYQGQGAGRAMVERSEAVARERGYKTMSLHARRTAVPFYLRLGYSEASDEFLEVGIPHIKMTKSMV